jgi:hypothetical protein
MRRLPYLRAAATVGPLGDLADRVRRANAQGLPRMGVVTYLSSALEAYRFL